MSHEAFSLLAEPIRRILWDMRWEELRPIQVQAIRHVLGFDGDLIIQAATAGGKTEAAFLPVLSRIAERPGESVRAIYVGPLKALINDQFQRLESLCKHAGIPVHRWHGDVGSGAKRRLIERPGGVLLITPESIESLMINRSGRLSGLFRDLEFVVIDEIHAFLGSERGTHLRSLLYRLGHHSRCTMRLLGLSATLGDAAQTAQWFGPGREDRVRVIRDEGEQKSVKFRIEAAVEPGAGTGGKGSENGDEGEGGDDGEADSEGGEGAESDASRKLARRMIGPFTGSTNLIFANARQDVELFADLLNDEAKARGQPQRFLVHHGALSREIREQTEAEMQSDRPTTALCSATLELGIDVGRVKTVGQIGPPWSVASLVQRLGRSGRREGEPAVMRIYLRARDPGPDAPLPDRLHTGLLRSIALTELMREKWVEPAEAEPLDLSTLIQQVLSVIKETGGADAETLHRRLVSEGAFRHIDHETFTEVLRSLGSGDLIEQAPDGTLILGLAGEKLVNHHEFYSAFATPEMFRVERGSQRIGEIPMLYPPQMNDHLLLGGRRWQVTELDTEKRVILVAPAQGSNPPRFTGAAGEIHPRIRQRMREVLGGDEPYAYLNGDAASLLEAARTVARQADLDRRELIPVDGKRCYWFTWTGTRIQRTLEAMCREAKIGALDAGVCLRLEHSAEEAADRLRAMHDTEHDPLRLAEQLREPQHRKYDRYLSPELLLRSAAENLIDVGGARAKLSDLIAKLDA